MIKRVCVVCEGQTEETFIRNVLAPMLCSREIFLDARMVPSSPGYKSGALSYPRVERFLHHTLSEDAGLYVTTMFDLYGLSSDFPGYALAQKESSLAQKLNVLNEEMHANVVTYTKCSRDRFIPYIQPYEFEALLFSDIASLVTLEPGWKSATEQLHQIRQTVESPEHINNRKETSPAARLQKYLKPGYDKVRHGSLAVDKIGLARIEQECRFFASWMEKLRKL